MRQNSFYFTCLLLSVLFVSCQKAPFLTLNTSKTINFTNQGGTQNITFSANRSWSVSSSDSWCKVSPSSGDKVEGDISVTVTCDPNTTYDPRSATLTVKVEELSETITVTQDTNLGLLVSPTSYDLTNAAQSIEVEVRANVKYAVEIDAACRDWITQTGTKALSTEKIPFFIAANESYDSREGKIIIKQTDGSLSETVIIKQAQTDGLIIGTKEFEVGKDGDTIEIQLQTNVEYDVVIPDEAKEWVTCVESAPTKALVNEFVYLQIADNPTYYNREASVTIKKKGADLQELIIIKQAQTDALFITDESREYKVPSKGGVIEVNVFHNIDFEKDAASIPEWVTISRTEVDTYNSKLTIKINQNSEYVGREAQVIINGGILSDIIIISQHQVDILNTDISEFSASWQETELTVIIHRNVEYTLTLPEWIVEKNKESKTEGYLTVDTIVYGIMENLGAERNANIVLTWNNEGANSDIVIGVKQSGCSVIVREAGTLIDILGTERIPKITGIKIEGYLNGTDIIIIRRMSSLRELNISDAHIRAGGQSYYADLNTKDDVIGQYMFARKDNPYLEEIILPKSITRIEWGAFDMSPIKKISDIPGTVYIEGEAFRYCAIQSIVLGEGIKTIEYGTFFSSGLLSATLPSSIVSIENTAFMYARSLKKVNIPDNVEKIGNEAFAECPIADTSITIPSTVKELGYGIFRGCTNIKEIHIKAYPSTLRKIEGVIADPKTVTLYIPKGTYKEYYLTPLGDFETIIEE